MRSHTVVQSVLNHKLACVANCSSRRLVIYQSVMAGGGIQNHEPL